jgi:hypothetical protein
VAIECLRVIGTVSKRDAGGPIVALQKMRLQAASATVGAPVRSACDDFARMRFAAVLANGAVDALTSPHSRM